MSIKNNTTSLQSLLDAVNSLPEANAGVELPELTNEGVASDLLFGKQLIDSDGNIVTGTIATMSSSDLIASKATITVPSGYYSTQVMKSIDSVTQATPFITVNASGLITATAIQSAGYVSEGNESATYQLAFQSAKTITPSVMDQVAVQSGVYTTGEITVSGDRNLMAGNIKRGVSIFGISGIMEVGAPDYTIEDSIITGALLTYRNDRVDYIRAYTFASCDNLINVSMSSCVNIGDRAFDECANLTSVNFPACAHIGKYAFAECANLTSVNFPACTSIGSSAFYSCNSLVSVSFPVCTIVNSGAFGYCPSLANVSIPKCTSIGYSAFYSCKSLVSVSFPVCTYIGNSAFNACSNLATVNFPKCESIGLGAFYQCRSLTSVNFPVCASIDGYAFSQCSSLTSVSFPVCTYIGFKAFSNCSNLQSADFPACSSIGISAFYGCTKLSALILRSTAMCTLAASNAFISTPIANGTGYIYVPSTLLASYQSATNWAYFSTQFSAIEDMPTD